MKKRKSITSNAIVRFETNQKTNFSVYYRHEDNSGVRGYPSGMHLTHKIKPRDINSLHFEGKCNGIGAGGPLGKDTDMFYNEDRNYKLFNFRVSLFTIKNYKDDVVGELTIEDEEEIEDFDTGKPFTRPAGINVDLIITQNLFDILENKIIEKHKILNNLNIDIGVYFEVNPNQKNYGKSVKTGSEYMHQTFSIPITTYTFNL